MAENYPKDLLVLTDISKYYTSGQSVVMGLHKVNLSFRAGEFVAVTGESGSGKSTLARVIAGILPYENGEMAVAGRPTSHYGHSDWEQYRCDTVGFISQSYDILPGCTVLKNVASALVLTGIPRNKATERAEDILRQVDLYDQRHKRAAKLSSGQKQRLSIARALAKPAPVLVADEPTGNLDAENSKKVIELLSAAAKGRLVIMITHDFCEVEDAASRHITIRDGSVASDVTLSPVDTDITLSEGPEQDTSGRPCRQVTLTADPVKSDSSLDNTSHPSPSKARGLSLYTAILQVTSRPVWSGITLLFFAMTAFAMFVFAGTFVVNLDDAPTRYYDNSAFVNGSNTRILVMKTSQDQEKSPLQEADWKALLALDYVDSVERYGYGTDMNYYYRQDIDYELHYTRPNDEQGGADAILKESVTFPGNSLFVQTVPCLQDDRSFLTAGRLPETMHEVVSAGDESLIGKTFNVYLRDTKNWAIDDYIRFPVTVTGVTGRGGHLYFSDELGRSLTHYYMEGKNFIVPYYAYNWDYYSQSNIESITGRFLYAVTLNESITRDVLDSLPRNSDYNAFSEAYAQMQYPFTNYQDPAEPVELGLLGCTTDATYRHFYGVDPEAFPLVTREGYGDLAALTISDYAYMDRVLEAVRNLGYTALSPYQAGTTRQDETLAAERLQTLKICLLSFCAVFLLQILVLRAMFGMETAQFGLLANLGLGCRTARRSITWQMLGFTVCGQFLAALTICLCGLAQLGQFPHILKHLSVPYMVLFSLIHLVTGLSASFWVQGFVSRQVYPYSLQEEDLKESFC